MGMHFLCQRGRAARLKPNRGLCRQL